MSRQLAAIELGEKLSCCYRFVYTQFALIMKSRGGRIKTSVSFKPMTNIIIIARSRVNITSRSR